MSVSTEVQRTLVKSPPELWSELSDPEALARHLGELGEIRITGIEPETRVEWEAEGASGVVCLKQSGWGTKVTLSVTREAPEPDGPSEPEPVAAVESEPAPEPERILEPEPIVTVETYSEPVTVEPEPEELHPVANVENKVEDKPEIVVATGPEPKLGFFARLFRKRQAKPVTVIEPEPIAASESAVGPDPEPACPRTGEEVVALAMPEPTYPPPHTPLAEPPAEAAPDLAAELADVEAQMERETTELLTGVLDRLGAAHHRPFSRG
jgi:hypothetical protein